MKRILSIALSVALLCVQLPKAQGQIVECVDLDGNAYPIPEGKKPVLVPAWLDPERLIVTEHVGENLQPVSLTTMVCDSGELAVSPAVCGE